MWVTCHQYNLAQSDFFAVYQLPPEVFVESSSVRVTEVGSHTRPTNVPPKMVGTGRAGC